MRPQTTTHPSALDCGVNADSYTQTLVYQKLRFAAFIVTFNKAASCMPLLSVAVGLKATDHNPSLSGVNADSYTQTLVYQKLRVAAFIVTFNKAASYIPLLSVAVGLEATDHNPSLSTGLWRKRRQLHTNLDLSKITRRRLYRHFQ
ncbi:hypothetical protein P3T73_02910 [Kiritimatiellota bacterium B12222]|nr:hypothetical protein P3T73_02910 [Kiritimatiellota bacterium B12222]